MCWINRALEQPAVGEHPPRRSLGEVNALGSSATASCGRRWQRCQGKGSLCCSGVTVLFELTPFSCGSLRKRNYGKSFCLFILKQPSRARRQQHHTGMARLLCLHHVQTRGLHGPCPTSSVPSCDAQPVTPILDKGFQNQDFVFF